VKARDESERSRIGPDKRKLRTKKKDEKNKDEEGGKSFAATELEIMENDLLLPLQIDRK